MELLNTILNLPPEKAKNVLVTLDPLERQVIEVLLKKKVALTAQQIINALVEELADHIMEKAEILEKNGAIFVKLEKPGWHHIDDVPSGEFRVYRSTGDVDVPLFEETFYPGRIYVKLSDFVKVLNDYLERIPKAKTKSEILDCKKKLVGYFTEIPSFRRVETTILPELIAAGLVVARDPTTKKRAKKLYAVNPVLLDIFREA
ncbi:MAG: hypothetical protein DRO98_07485 [Archaeoglobales archaeon]|nr:MAG: hypothetical protein DRO98_07485 [Archaeoglobales archaeon]